MLFPQPYKNKTLVLRVHFQRAERQWCVCGDVKKGGDLSLFTVVVLVETSDYSKREETVKKDTSKHDFSSKIKTNVPVSQNQHTFLASLKAR